MTIRLLHLYPNYMNLYGDYGNITVMERLFREHDITVEIGRFDSIGETDPADWDFIYIGSGTESNQKHVAGDLAQKAEPLRALIDEGLPVLATGNACELFGSRIEYGDGVECAGLGIYDGRATMNRKRQVGDVIYSADWLTKPVVGFINRTSALDTTAQRLFTVSFGIGGDSSGISEGVRVNNFFGTYVIGPILVRNPHLLAHLARIIFERLKPDAVFEGIVDKSAEKAYNIVLEELLLRKKMKK